MDHASWITRATFLEIVACVAGGIRERASSGGAANLAGEAREGIRERRSREWIQLDSAPILSRLHHSRSRLPYQNKSTRARNPASYADY